MNLRTTYIISSLAFGALALFAAFLPVHAFAANAYVSSNWAGYVANTSSYKGVGATWVVGEADEDNDQSGHATWVGIGGFGRKDLIQAGTMALTDSDDETVYLAWYEILPAPAIPLRIPIKAGDSITVSIVETKRDEWAITVTNDTTGKSITKRLDYDSSRASAEFVQEMLTVGDGLRVPIDDFGEAAFSDAWIIQGNKKVDLVRANVKPITMIDRKEKKLVIVSDVEADRKSFSVTRTEIPATFKTVVQDSKAARKIKDDTELFDIRARVMKDGRFSSVRILAP